MTMLSDSDKNTLSEIAAIALEKLLLTLNADADGLSENDAADRLKHYGKNVVACENEDSFIKQLLQKLRNPLNILLIVLSIISLITSNVQSALIIFLMVVLSVSLAFFHERRSNRAALALRSRVHTTATVARRAEPGRDPVAKNIAIERLVPGDIIHLAAGDLIPADARLLTAKDLFVNQSALTGESMPAEKFALIEEAGTHWLDLRNICFMGTSVEIGTATAVVIHTGRRAIFGKIAESTQGETEPTNFDLGIAKFTWLMIRVIAVMAPLVFFINGGFQIDAAKSYPTWL